MSELEIGHYVSTSLIAAALAVSLTWVTAAILRLAAVLLATMATITALTRVPSWPSMSSWVAACGRGIVLAAMLR
jgi:hypothetical protein